MRPPRGITVSNGRVIGGQLVYDVHVARWRMALMCVCLVWRIRKGGFRSRWWEDEHNRAAILDSLRRCADMLSDVRPYSSLTDYHFEESEYAVAVARRLLRNFDRDGKTDRTVR